MSNSEGEINLKHIGKDGPQPCYLCSNFLTMIRILALLIVVAIMACNNAANNNTPKAKTQADSLMDKVIEGHNVAMAKMTKLHQTKNQIQQVLDSISKLRGGAQKNSVHYKTALDSAFNRLTRADNAMEKWMSEFNMDSASNDAERRVKYLEVERVKISTVKDEIINSLQNADSLIKKRF
jgi:TolA-binding protein